MSLSIVVLSVLVVIIGFAIDTLRRSQKANTQSVLYLAQAVQINKDRIDALYASHFELMKYMGQQTMSTEDSAELNKYLSELQELVLGVKTDE